MSKSLRGPSLRDREAEEGFDLVGDTLHGVANLADGPGDAVHDSLDDVSTPLECLGGERFDPVDGAVKPFTMASLMPVTFSTMAFQMFWKMPERIPTAVLQMEAMMSSAP